MTSMTSMTMDMDMGMATTFEFSCDAGPLLFSWWKINNCTSLYLSCIPVIMLGCARHWAFNCVAGSKRSVKECSQARTTALLDGPSYQQANEVEDVMQDHHPDGTMTKSRWHSIARHSDEAEV